MMDTRKRPVQLELPLIFPKVNAKSLVTKIHPFTRMEKKESLKTVSHLRNTGQGYLRRTVSVRVKSQK